MCVLFQRTQQEICFIWCGPFLKSLLNLLQCCFCSVFWFFWPGGLWDLSFLTRDQTHTPCPGRWSLNHWNTREVPPQNKFQMRKFSLADLDQNSLFPSLIYCLPWFLPIFVKTEAGNWSKQKTSYEQMNVKYSKTDGSRYFRVIH